MTERARGSKIRNTLLLLAIALGPACGHRSGTDDPEARSVQALGIVESCRADARRCHDYAGSPAASTVCDQKFRSCLAGLVQEGDETVGRQVVLPVPQQACISDVRSCLLAMNAPATCALRASDCLEATARRTSLEPARSHEARP